ncbi:MAG: SUMF1/EgtB/PvdO family nonheme iron enzyme [Cyanothece sp. SIO1E1]|nr:SUMF1/EgtB/PvdO family nonheme iron enzyme [Cyanothece sp. SIO1E1]
MSGFAVRDQIFISYSHRDKQWLAQLQVHLKPLIRNRTIDVWDDTKIEAGSDWQKEIDKALAAAKVAVLMVSPDFLASDFIANNELPQLLDGAKREGLTIIWIPVRHSFYKATEIKKYQAAHSPEQPIAGLTPSEQDKAWVDICEEIKKAFNAPTTKDFVTPSKRKTPSVIKQAQQTDSFTEDLGNGVTLEMVRIPAGSFMMGSPKNEKDRQDDEGPQHLVNIPEFYIGKCQVTQAQWRVVANLVQIVNLDLELKPSHFKGDNLPVERVNWYEAVEFCDRLSIKTGKTYRLPSEAEWEYACRAGTKTRYHFGNEITPELANYNENKGKTTPVGSYAPNDFGLYDMHGNVWEWCLDHWHDNYEGAPTNGSAWTTDGDSSRRVLRGGSWYLYPDYCRAAGRVRNGPDLRFDYLGLRVVCVSARTP